jgi:hypothetical protein
VADEIDATSDPMQPAGRQAVVDRGAADAGIEELAARHHAPLLGSELADDQIQGPGRPGNSSVGGRPDNSTLGARQTLYVRFPSM